MLIMLTKLVIANRVFFERDPQTNDYFIDQNEPVTWLHSFVIVGNRMLTDAWFRNLSDMTFQDTVKCSCSYIRLFMLVNSF